MTPDARHRDTEAPRRDDGDAVLRLAALAEMHRAAGDREAAELALREACRLRPQDAALLTNHGLVLSEMGRAAEAAARQREAVALAPQFAPAWHNLALALRLAGRSGDALAAEREARRLAPDAPQTRIANGLEALATGQPMAAQAEFRAALAVDRTIPEAWINLATVASLAGDAVQSRALLEQALRLAPHDARALSNLAMLSQYDAALSATELRTIAERAAAGREAGRPVAPRPAAGARLRVGWLSGDFYAHPVGWLAAPVLEAHDRERIEMHAFVTARPPDAADPMAARLRGAFEHWHDLAGLDDATIAERIAAAGIEVLLDLGGHTESGRLGVIGLRPAPVQLAWLGYFGSTGMASIDAVILGDALAPPGTEAYCSEAIERVRGLHAAYAPPPYAPTPGPPPSESRGHVSFGSFNNPAKMGDDVVQTWSALLRKVAGSRLVLKWRSFADPAFAAATLGRFAAHGIAPERVELRPGTRHDRMLAEYGDIDVALDPFPFCGLTTTLEALWMGVPLVTLRWPRPVSRQTHAVLQAIGVEDWSTTTPAAYVETAAALAADVTRRRGLRTGLRERLSASPICNAGPLARELEAIFERRTRA